MALTEMLSRKSAPRTPPRGLTTAAHVQAENHRVAPQPGDVVMAYTPDRPESDRPGTHCRPCVVVWTQTHREGTNLELVPGRPDRGTPETPTEIKLGGREARAVGAKGDWRFDARDTVKLPWSRDYASRESKGRPIGNLDPDTFDRFSEAYGRAAQEKASSNRRALKLGGDAR